MAAPFEEDESIDEGSAGETLESPFPCLQVDLSQDDLRETVYEVFLAAQEMQASSSPGRDGTASGAVASPIKSGAVRRFKKALTMGKKKSCKQMGTLELMRLQMEISEKSDVRSKKALAKAQAARPMRKLLVPLELLQHTSAADFSDFREYKRWQKRQLKVLEAGLLTSDKENSDSCTRTVRQVLSEIAKSPHEAAKHPETLQALRNAAYTVAGNDVHWADGYPLNVYLYEMLLRSIFDNLEETAFIDELEEVMLFVKSTWSILGLNKLLHKVCFVWILFRQFVVTGTVEPELLKGAEMELREISSTGDFDDDYVTYDLLNSTLTYVQAWTERRLIAYHDNFPDGGNGVMESLAAVAILAVQILHKCEFQQVTIDPEDEHDMASSRVGIYIQSSVRCAFDELLRRRRPGGGGALEVLAKKTAALLLKEKELFSPIWKNWHPHPTSVAAATLHSCYRVELRTFLSGFTEVSSEAIQILQSAAELEKKLVQLDMDDKSVFDTRSATIPAMTPFTLDADLRAPLKQWIQVRLEQLEAWLERNAQQEEWSPNDTRDHYALSTVEMLRIVEEASDAFFSLPVSQHPELLHDIVNVIDFALKQYIDFCLSGCENKDAASPDPELRRQKEFAASILGKVSEAWQSKQEVLGFNKGKAHERAVAAQVEELDDMDFPSLEVLCVRINSVSHMQAELEFVEKKLCFKWQEIPFTKETRQIKLEQARAFCNEAIEKLCDAAAYRVVSLGLSSVFWQGLYIPTVLKSRIGPVVEALNSHLEVIAGLVPGRLRNKVANYLMMAAFQGFLRVLVDVNSTRAVSSGDAAAVEEDLFALKELFKAEGEGLPEDVVEAAAEPIWEYIASIRVEVPTGLNFRGTKLEANLKQLMLRKPSKSQMVSATQGVGKVSSALGYKCHAMASKLVKKTYSFSKR